MESGLNILISIMHIINIYLSRSFSKAHWISLLSARVLNKCLIISVRPTLQLVSNSLMLPINCSLIKLLLAPGSFFRQEGGKMPAFINVIITALIRYVSVARWDTKNLILHQDTDRETRNVEQRAFTTTHDCLRRWNGILLLKDAREMKPVNCMLRVQSQNMMMIVTGTWEMMKKVYTSAGNSTSCLGVLHDVTLWLNHLTFALKKHFIEQLKHFASFARRIYSVAK